MINVRKLYLVGLTLVLAGCQQHTAGPQPTTGHRATTGPQAAVIQQAPLTVSTPNHAVAKQREALADVALRQCLNRGLVEFLQPNDVYTTTALAYDSCGSEVREWMTAMIRELDIRFGATTPQETIEKRIIEFRPTTIAAYAVALRRRIDKIRQETEKTPPPEAPRRKPTEHSI